MSTADQVTYQALEARLRTILPPEYQDVYDDVRPISMGSACLIYASDGQVAWNEIWKTFCDLAMAGGPPHKGTLLEPGALEEIAAQAGRYRQVTEEICRGVRLVTGLEAAPSRMTGWVRVECASATMAGWLVRAIVMENVSCRCEGAAIFLPAGPGYRIEKEIKNVITVIAKTCHYWVGHMPGSQQDAIGALFAALEQEEPLVQPVEAIHTRLADALHQATGLQASSHQYAAWSGYVCPDVHAAVWMMRMLVASNVLARREGTTIFVPIASDPDALVRRFVRAHGFAKAQGIL